MSSRKSRAHPTQPNPTNSPQIPPALTQVKQLRRRLETVLNAAGEGIFGVDTAGQFVFVNPAAAEMLGYSPEDLLGQVSHTVCHHTQANGAPYPQEVCPIYAAYRDGTVHRGDDELFWRKDGSSFRIEYVSTPIFEHNALTGAVVVFSDITDRVHLAEELRQAQKMEAIGRLAGGMAHDFNNILTVIIGHSELLLHHYLKPGQPGRQEVEEIKIAGERAAALTHQLLAFSRRQPVQPQHLDLNEAVCRLEQMLRRLIGEDIELRTRLDPTLKTIYIDPSQLEQVVLNLSVNARDAMPYGGLLTLETAGVQLDAPFHHLQPGSYARLSVTDTGSGMDAVTQAHCFEPFYTTKAAGKGTGLGLSTAYGIIRQNGGHIWVNSTPGQGATVATLLPQSVAPLPAPRPAAEPAGWSAGTEIILLVEDEPGVRLVLSKALQKHGYYVLEAESPQMALQLCRDRPGPIDLLVSDVVMPGINGPAMVEQIRLLRPGIKCLYISGHADDALTQHGTAALNAPFLPKPFTSQILLGKIREVLNDPGQK
jgi:PAS domain S-box-containing protein